MKITSPSQILALILGLFILGPPAQAQHSGLIATRAEVELVQDGFAFLEGPVSDPDGTLYFTDIDNNRVHRMDNNGNIMVAYEPSNHAKGLTLDLDGSLLICEQSGQRLTRMDRNGNVSVVAYMTAFQVVGFVECHRQSNEKVSSGSTVAFSVANSKSNKLYAW